MLALSNADKLIFSSDKATSKKSLKETQMGLRKNKLDQDLRNQWSLVAKGKSMSGNRAMKKR